MKQVIVYTTTYCLYCVRAKQLLGERGIAFKEVQLSEDDDASWDALYEKSKMKTVPQIFAGERLIGGYTELAALDKQDRLSSLKSG